MLPQLKETVLECSLATLALSSLSLGCDGAYVRHIRADVALALHHLHELPQGLVKLLQYQRRQNDGRPVHSSDLETPTLPSTQSCQQGTYAHTSSGTQLPTEDCSSPPGHVLPPPASTDTTYSTPPTATRLVVPTPTRLPRTRHQVQVTTPNLSLPTISQHPPTSHSRLHRIVPPTGTTHCKTPALEKPTLR
jgi:hypothetical protein